MISMIEGAALSLPILFTGLLAVVPSANADGIKTCAPTWLGAKSAAANDGPDHPARANGTFGFDRPAGPHPGTNDGTDLSSSLTGGGTGQ